MKRQVDFNKISDGKLYQSNDMVKIGCDGCNGKSICCSGMGKSIILDPWDINRMKKFLGKTFEELLSGYLELNVVDGIILPNIAMNGEKEECRFLEMGRCTIHSVRPGICRLFPLGRIYENGNFSYFLQVDECAKKNSGKVKIKNWLDIDNLKAYEHFVNKWHDMLVFFEDRIRKSQDDTYAKTVSMYILQKFYIDTFDSDITFYADVEARIDRALKELAGEE